jgi:ABC-type branched-subunit amino acid transport system substrate-binding protein
MPMLFHWLFLVLLALLVTGCNRQPRIESVPIGHVVALTGSDRSAGEDIQHAIQLIVDESNQPEQLEDSHRRIVVLHADSQGEKDLGPTAVRLITLRKVAALLGGTDPSAVDSLAGVARSSNVPLVAAAGIPGLPQNDYCFHLGLAPDQVGQALARFASQELKAKRVAILASGRQSTEFPDPGLVSAWTAAFAREFRQRDGAITGESTFKKPSDMKDLLGQGSVASAEAVLLAGAAEDVRELRRLGLAEVPILFAGTEDSGHMLAGDAHLAAVYLTTAYAEDGATPRGGDFQHHFQEQFHHPPDARAVLAADCAAFLIEGIRKARTVESAPIQKALAEITEFDSLTGPLKFDKNHWARRMAFVVQLIKGRATSTKRYEPGADE